MYLPNEQFSFRVPVAPLNYCQGRRFCSLSLFQFRPKDPHDLHSFGGGLRVLFFHGLCCLLWNIFNVWATLPSPCPHPLLLLVLDKKFKHCILFYFIYFSIQANLITKKDETKLYRNSYKKRPRVE